MSAFVSIFHRDGRPVDPARLASLAASLESYGEETATWCRGPLGVAVRHRRGARHAPIHTDEGSGRLAALAGHLHLADATEPATAAGLLAGSEAESGEGPAGARGSFALLLADPRRGRLHLQRDPLGKHGVFYALGPDLLLAASEPSALVAHPAVGDEIDEAAVARFLGFRFPAGEGSFHRAIRQLPPGHRLVVGDGEATVERCWRLRRLPALAGGGADELAAGLVTHLAQAVGDEIAGGDPRRVAISLSGGLDSTALAAVAPRGARAFSWTFADHPEADERRRVEAVARHLELPLTFVPGDGLEPLTGDFFDRFVHPESPYVNPFAALKCRLYATARDAGCEQVLVGDGGDALHAAREHWLRDLLAAREPGALGSLATTLRRATGGDRFARRALGRLLPFDRLRRPLRRLLRRDPPPWLTAEGRAALPPSSLSPTLPPGPQRTRHELTAGVLHGELESEERRLFAYCGVERGNPFWSWPLVEWALR
ncbi:MAG TPA: asparagine synthase-related protein, partial [Thermoanaerobaculia bacterium]|nr:asparagine synthase-related protein [Thermoanaerobaculia bacterium]